MGERMQGAAQAANADGKLMGWPIERKIRTGLGLAMTLVVIIALVSYRNTKRLVETHHRMSAHTQQLLGELEALRSAIIDAQHGSRDYVVTGDERFLKLHGDSVSQIQTHLKRLQDLTADNHDQQERIVVLDRKINERLLAYDEIINRRKASGSEVSREILNSVRDKTARSEVSLIVTEVVRQVNDFMRTQSENAERSASNAVVTLTALVLLALILFSVASYLIRRDILERKRAEAVLHESKERYRELFENANDLVFTLDLNGNFTSANRAVEEVTGYSRNESGKVNFAQVLAPEHAEAARQMLARKLSDNKPTTYAMEIVTRDGRRVPLEISTRLMCRDGKPVGVQGIGRDITSRKREEEVLREAEERFRKLFEDAPVAYHEIDTQGIVRRVNRAECDLLGFEASEMLGIPIWDFVAKEKREMSREAVFRKLSGQQALIPFQREYARRDNTRLIFEIHENLMRDKNGLVVGIRSTMLDVTERERTAEELGRRTMEITLLSQLGNLLQACLTTEEAYKVIAQFAPTLFPTAPGSICVLSASRNLVEAVAVWGDTPSGEHVFAPDDCWALRSGRLHFVNNPRSPLLCRHVSPSFSSSFLCVPMMAQGEALGVLHIQSGPSGTTQDSMSATKQQLAMTLAEQIGLALANLKLRETLRMQSIRDPLTSLYNRRYMEESLERELRRAARNKGSLGAIMLDLDHFKQYNDTFGHDAGDSLLRELGNFLQTQVRGEDIACRFGGEEFLLILPEASVEATQERAEELRQGIKHVHVHHHGRALGTVTVSLGAAIFPDHGTTAEALIHAADEALYDAKEHGRDKVVVARAVQPEPKLVS